MSIAGTLVLKSDGTWSYTPESSPSPTPTPAPSPSALLGATVDLASGTYSGCGGGALDECSAQTFDTYVSHGLAAPITPAETCQKVYLAEGNLPATPPASWTAFHNRGGKLLISFKPPRTFSLAGDAAFRKLLEACVTAFGVSGFQAVLWQEPNTSKSGFTAAQYHDYFAHYAPLVHAVDASIVIVYDPALCGPGDACNATSCGLFYPGDLYVGGVAGDYYGTAHNGGTTLDVLETLADNHKPNPVPLYLGEWAASAVGTYTFDLAKWTAYTAYLAKVATDRRAAGKLNGWWLYWGSSSAGGPGTNIVRSGTDAKVAGIQAVHKALLG